MFGCKCFEHIPKDERSKLDVKSNECIFIGYGQDELIQSRDVVLVEHQTIKDIEKVKRSNTKVNGGLIDFDLIPTTKDATNGDAFQQNENREDVDEPGIL